MAAWWAAVLFAMAGVLALFHQVSGDLAPAYVPALIAIAAVSVAFFPFWDLVVYKPESRMSRRVRTAIALAWIVAAVVFVAVAVRS